MAGVVGRSGDKPKREKYAKLYASTQKQMHAILPEVPAALRELVVGVWIEESDRHGGRRIYQQPPNVKAIELLLNRTMGDTTKHVELSGPGGEALTVTWNDGRSA